jgi:hypothetical protein
LLVTVPCYLATVSLLNVPKASPSQCDAHPLKPLTSIKFDLHYVAPTPAISSARLAPNAAKVPTNAFVHYNASCLIESVQSFHMQEAAAMEPQDELTRYLQVGPEPTTDVVGWWGVSISNFLPPRPSDLTIWQAKPSPSDYIRTP